MAAPRARFRPRPPPSLRHGSAHKGDATRRGRQRRSSSSSAAVAAMAAATAGPAPEPLRQVRLVVLSPLRAPSAFEPPSPPLPSDGGRFSVTGPVLRAAAPGAVSGAPAASPFPVGAAVPGAGPSAALPQRPERPRRAPPARLLSSAPRGPPRPGPSAAPRHGAAGAGGADVGRGPPRAPPAAVPVPRVGSALLPRRGAAVSDVARTVPAVAVPAAVPAQLLAVSALLAAVPPLQDGTVPPLHRYRPLPLRRPLPVCPRPRGAAGAPPPPQIPHAAVQHLPALRDVSVRLPLPLPARPRAGGGERGQPGQPPPPPGV